MNSREQIYRDMKSLRLYRLKKGEMTLVQCELESYLSVLEQTEQERQSIYADLFLEDCSRQRLESWERLLAIPVNPEISEEKRREIAKKKRSISPNDFHKEGLERSLAALGIKAEIEEQPGKGKIVVTAREMADTDMTLDQAKQVFVSLMPAHLEAEFVTGGICFSEFDELNKSFDELDRMDKSWSQLEMMGKEEWTGGKSKIAEQ